MMNSQLWFAEAGKVELRETADAPKPPAGHIQIEMMCGGICRFDVALFEGVLPDLLPRAAGHEAVGEVVAVGDGVTEVKRGQYVSLIGEATALPYFTQRLNVPANLSAVLPCRPDRPELWLAEPVACVVNALSLSPAPPGSRVAVVGAGFMGLLFVQGLRGQPAGEVVAVDLNEERLKLARTFGAEGHAIAAADKWHELERNLGRFDLVIETAGTQASLDMACALLGAGGELVIFAWHKVDGGKRQIDASAWHQRGVRISNHAPISNRHFAELHQPTIELMRRGLYDLRPLVTHTSTFQKAQSLFELATKGEEGYIKGALRW